MANPRKLALASLIKAEASGTYSNIEVNTVLTRTKLSKLDASLYTALYLGVTERAITLDYQITKHSSTHIMELDIETKNALRLGLYQLIFMDKIPDYSAVSETVNICPKRSKGFVNACLRSFIRGGKELSYPADKWEALAIKTSIPVSIINIFKSSYGEAEAVKIAESCKQREGTYFRINTLKITPNDLVAQLKARKASYEKTTLGDDIVLIKAPISDFIDLIDLGYGFVQDISSYSCVKMIAPRSGEWILDACSCPGGKSFSSAIEMKNKGKIFSCDLHKNKLRLVQSGATKLGIDIIEVREQDAKLENAEFFGRFDKVLCDAPCSGLGVISKKPDIKYKPIEQIYNLPEIQMAIVKNCAKYVKLGGELIYSTCTLNAEENEKIVKRFLKLNGGFVPVDFELGALKSTNGMFTFMPHKLKADGFFVAKMKRVK